MPVFIRQVMSLLSTSVFSRCEVGGIYKAILSPITNCKFGGLTPTANSGVPETTLRFSIALEGLPEVT